MTAYCSNLESFFRNWFTTCNGGALNYLRVRENGKYYQCILLYITLHYELNKHNPELKIVSLSTSVSCGSCKFFCIKFSWNSFLTFWLSMTSVRENGRDYSPFSPLPPIHNLPSARSESRRLVSCHLKYRCSCVVVFFATDILQRSRTFPVVFKIHQGWINGSTRVLKWELKVIDKL